WPKLPYRPTTEEALRITPEPWRIMWGTTAREQRKTPLRLTEMTESKASSVILPATAPSFHLTNCASRVMPALLMSTSTAPHRPTTSATADSTSASLHTLILRKSASSPSEDSWRSNSSCPASLTSHAATRQPSLANRRAVARPIPAAAPVTMTTLPRRPVSFIGLLKTHLKSELNYARPRARRQDLSKVRRCEDGVSSIWTHRIRKAHVVERIEEFPSELNFHPFRHREHLHNINVDIFL